MFSDLSYETIRARIKVLFGHYCCPDCHKFDCNCNTDCDRRHQDQIHEIARAFGDGKTKEQQDEARKLLDELISEIGENQPEIIRMETYMAFMSGED